MEQGAEASLRDIARRAGVGMGTLYRHFPNRDSLLEALLRSRFAALTARAESLLLAADPAAALLEWLAESVAFTHQHRGIIAPLMSAIDDPESALHSACVALRAAGTSLLTRAQQAGQARPDLSGDELFDLIAALAWLREQPSHAPRAERILAVLADAILTAASGGWSPTRQHAWRVTGTPAFNDQTPSGPRWSAPARRRDGRGLPASRRRCAAAGAAGAGR